MSASEQSRAAGDELQARRAPGEEPPTPISGEDRRLGDLGARLQLIEYGDYECPYCAAAQPGVSDLIARHADELVFAFRHFPLVSQHPHAWGAALAAEAAGRQGKFWEMHAHLFSHQAQLGHDDLAAHARDLGLDVERFLDDLADGALADRVRRDAEAAVHSGVRGTPTFFVNGRRIDGGYREPEIEAALLDAAR